MAARAAPRLALRICRRWVAVRGVRTPSAAAPAILADWSFRVAPWAAEGAVGDDVRQTDGEGAIQEMDERGRSLNVDRRRKAKTKPKSDDEAKVPARQPLRPMNATDNARDEREAIGVSSGGTVALVFQRGTLGDATGVHPFGIWLLPTGFQGVAKVLNAPAFTDDRGHLTSEILAEMMDGCARQRAVRQAMRSVIRQSLVTADTMRKSAEAMQLHAALARRQGRQIR